MDVGYLSKESTFIIPNRGNPSFQGWIANEEEGMKKPSAFQKNWRFFVSLIVVVTVILADCQSVGFWKILP